ncbi:sulfite exporter TauE/SafE family protein [Streptomyces olivochromogenes]|uniref:sulfite exporter TauE/SafE family protein n=1 Tax=Streptomyces olivochromogenes TaxID=1963 RepID=UPI001F225F28|nr:sulfite exporter TauE/SafE family protein [Streptomyces olivochromogenes]MCF3130055.1 sulfite exporter TauE/SafE family protein [Streptomyces olivochromogenes]
MSGLLLALGAGAVSGLALGALGGGGSVLAVPALIYLLGFTPAAATTAALVVVAVTSGTALAAHAREGTVRWRAGLVFAAAGLVPAAVGGAVSRQLPSALLTGAFAALAAVAAVRMLRPSAAAAVRMLRPSAAVRDEAASPRASRIAGAGAGLGAVTGVLGVGGGFLAVPALVNVVGLRMRAAVGTSLLVITLNSVAALAARAGSAVVVDWSAVAPFAAAAVLGAWDGKRLAGRLSSDSLQRVFACALLAVAAFMLVDAVR